MTTPSKSRGETEGLPPELGAIESRLADARSDESGVPLPDVVRRRVRGARWSRRIRLGGASALVVIVVGLGSSLVGTLTGPAATPSRPDTGELQLVGLPIGEPPQLDPGLSRLTVALGRDPALLWSILDGDDGGAAGDGFSDPAPGADDAGKWPAPTQPEGNLPPA